MQTKSEWLAIVKYEIKLHEEMYVIWDEDWSNVII